MQLLPEDKLIWSPVVANTRMNRERNSSGVNSYEQEFKFKPEIYLEKEIIKNGQASWLDLCCGKGNALMQAADFFSARQLQDKVLLKGIDLVNSFFVPDHIRCLQFESRSIVDWVPAERYDLITCVHGIHYLGNKLKVMEAAMAALTPGGLFIANFDLNNIVITGVKSSSLLKDMFKKDGVKYNSRTKILSCTGPLTIHFNLSYLGADDTSGPNYTGQEAVTSYYAIN